MRQQTEEKGNQTNQVWGLNNDPLVELAGFEPATLCLQSRCATSCAIAPKY